MNKRPQGSLLFKIALVSDTHVNEREDASASPYLANAEANARARHAFSQINQNKPAFIVHLGDMINPVPELPTYSAAVENFHALAGALQAPLYLVPGNHDIGDKPVAWMPAGMVDGESIALYRRHFGEDFRAFDHAGCHFVIINAPLINSEHQAEADQRRWLEADLAAHSGMRLFLFTHYPLYVSDAAEPESYDNIDEPGRGWLLGLIRRYKPEAVFAAHVHNFWYDRIDATEYYVVPSTCFVRHDYSEMYRIDGGDQKGRNDGAKLGHITLDIYENGHVAHYHRSYGATLAKGEAAPVALRPHVKTSNLTGIYVDMRHAWAEEMVVAPSGALDEFRRKRARNDYTLMALWEMGLRGLRVPIQDLQDARTRRRMEIMTDVGHLFHVYLYGLPNSRRGRSVGRASAGRLSAGARCELGRDRRKHRTPAVSFRRHPAPNHSVTRQPEGSRQACRRPVQSSDKPWLQSRGSRRAGRVSRRSSRPCDGRSVQHPPQHLAVAGRGRACSFCQRDRRKAVPLCEIDRIESGTKL